jgi:hypothetical protein
MFSWRTVWRQSILTEWGKEEAKWECVCKQPLLTRQCRIQYVKLNFIFKSILLPQLSAFMFWLFEPLDCNNRAFALLMLSRSSSVISAQSMPAFLSFHRTDITIGKIWLDSSPVSGFTSQQDNRNTRVKTQRGSWSFDVLYILHYQDWIIKQTRNEEAEPHHLPAVRWFPSWFTLRPWNWRRNISAKRCLSSTTLCIIRERTDARIAVVRTSHPAEWQFFATNVKFTDIKGMEYTYFELFECCLC